jgi:uncharacterized protein (UPF0332 family)
VDWFDYFDLAQEWVGEDSEAHQRSAVSRAYYAMYLTARDKLDDANRYHPSGSESLHVYVWNKYKTYPEYDHIGGLGNRLRKKRIEADYHNLIDYFELADDAIELAEELKEALDEVTHIR